MALQSFYSSGQYSIAIQKSTEKHGRFSICYTVPMSTEQSPSTSENRAERTARLEQEIKNAKEHALDVVSEANFLQLYADLCDAEKFPVPPDNYDPEELTAMETRVLKATAQTRTISEFKELLRLIPGLSEEKVIDILEHENAHANVAQQLDTVEFKGYGAVFFKNDDEIVSVTPTTFIDREAGGDRVQFLLDNMAFLEAPDTYGHHMSDDDVVERDRLQDIYEQHTTSPSETQKAD